MNSVGANKEIIRNDMGYQNKVAKEEAGRQMQLGLESQRFGPLLEGRVKAPGYAGGL